MKKVIYPKCKKNEFDADSLRDYSISRRDKKSTKICNPCGNVEAFEDMPKEKILYKRRHFDEGLPNEQLR